MDEDLKSVEFDMQEFFVKMANYASFEKDVDLRIVQEFPDGSIEVGHMYDGAFLESMWIVSFAGEFLGHSMLKVKGEIEAFVNAVPAAVVCLFEV